MGGMSAIIAEFLAESVENLDIMDQDLVALGRFMLTQQDDLSLAALLKSPLFGLSEEQLNKMIAIVVRSITKHDFSTQKDLLASEHDFLEMIKQVNKNQIKRLNNGEVGTKSSILFLNIINEIKNLSLQLVNLYKSQRDFINFKNGPKV